MITKDKLKYDNDVKNLINAYFVNLTNIIKDFWKGDFESNLELLEVVINGLGNQIEIWEKQETSSQKPNIENTEEKIEWLKKCLMEEYEYYERTKNNPYWFRTLSVDRIKEYEHKINKHHFTLQILKGIKQGLTPEAIKAAKEYPMESLIKLNKANFALCPFHNERTASFKVFKDNNWRCFGCGERGDTIDFIQKKENIGFEEAVKKLLKL